LTKAVKIAESEQIKVTRMAAHDDKPGYWELVTGPRDSENYGNYTGILIKRNDPLFLAWAQTSGEGLFEVQYCGDASRVTNYYVD